MQRPHRSTQSLSRQTRVSHLDHPKGRRDNRLISSEYNRPLAQYDAGTQPPSLLSALLVNDSVQSKGKLWLVGTITSSELCRQPPQPTSRTNLIPFKNLEAFVSLCFPENFIRENSPFPVLVFLFDLDRPDSILRVPCERVVKRTHRALEYKPDRILTLQSSVA